MTEVRRPTTVRIDYRRSDFSRDLNRGVVFLQVLSFVFRATIVLRELQTEAADEFSIPAAFSMNIVQIVEIVRAVEIVERL